MEREGGREGGREREGGRGREGEGGREGGRERRMYGCRKKDKPGVSENSLIKENYAVPRATVQTLDRLCC